LWGRLRGDRMARARKRKTGKTSQDIFTPTRTGGAKQQGRRPGRPPVHDEAWTKVTVVLFNRQIVFLDRLAANIRAQSGAAISRAQLIRALLDAVADADVDLTTATSDADLKATLLARLGRYRISSPGT
ncbi:MAG TPA: hypothetical protein VEL79_17510, partial [Vicinamibacterales bacterium]|nr:hypothetical protein [Vicinamibacterales bacterium]